MKKILVLHTGGTISMVKKDGGLVVLSSENPLSGHDDIFKTRADLTIKNVFNLPSPHIGLKEMSELKKIISQSQDEFDGVVITHGTDTLEETAYFLDITLDKKIPVVLTGAMRSSDDIGSDGLYNFMNAILVAVSEKSKHQNVLVVMNDEIHAAKFVTKTHTTNVDTFRTPTFGPIGIILKDEVYFLSEATRRNILDINTCDDDVLLIKAFAGMDETLFELFLQSGKKGLVIEALGAGNLPPKTLAPLKKILDKNIPVALISRCSNGVSQDIYNYTGGGAELKQMGLVFVKLINGSKARIRMAVALNAGLSLSEINDFMAI